MKSRFSLVERSTVEFIACETCGEDFPVFKNQSPMVPRETRCQRCFSAENGYLMRRIAALESQAAPEGGHQPEMKEKDNEDDQSRIGRDR